MLRFQGFAQDNASVLMSLCVLYMFGNWLGSDERGDWRAERR
jgi:hypothetical protein